MFYANNTLNYSNFIQLFKFYSIIQILFNYSNSTIFFDLSQVTASGINS